MSIKSVLEVVGDRSRVRLKGNYLETCLGLVRFDKVLHPNDKVAIFGLYLWVCAVWVQHLVGAGRLQNRVRQGLIFQTHSLSTSYDLWNRFYVYLTI